MMYCRRGSTALVLSVVTYLTLVVTVSPVEGQLPAKGLYATLRGDALAQASSVFSLKLAGEVNSYTGTPSIKGKAKGVSYTLSGFSYEVVLDGFTLLPSTSPQFSFGWENMYFFVSFNGKFCKFIFCDKDTIWIYTTGAARNGVAMIVDTNLDLSGPRAVMTAKKVSLSFTTGDVEVFAQGGSAKDVANAVAQDFVATFQNELKAMVNKVAQQYIDDISTTLDLSTLGLDLLLDGGFIIEKGPFLTPTDRGIIAATEKRGLYANSSSAFSFVFSDLADNVSPAIKPSIWQAHNMNKGLQALAPEAFGSNFVFFLDGTFVPAGKPALRPPFPPTSVPPNQVVGVNPPGMSTLVFTPYMLQAALWALQQSGDFNATLTPQQVPANPYIQLNTNNQFMQHIAPHLTAFPNMDIYIDTWLQSTGAASISATGDLTMTGVLGTTFSLKNSSYSHAGWSLLTTFALSITPNTSMSGSQVAVTFSLSGAKFNTTVKASAVGAVDASAADQILNMIVAAYGSKYTIPPVVVPAPAGFVVSNPTIVRGDGYSGITCQLQYNAPTDAITCPGGILCPAKTTCCNGGCCLASHGQCCPSGCCQAGWHCCGVGKCCK